MKPMKYSDPIPTTDDEALAYLPEQEHLLYRYHRRTGCSILEAMYLALKVCTDTKNEDIRVLESLPDWTHELYTHERSTGKSPTGALLVVVKMMTDLKR